MQQHYRTNFPPGAGGRPPPHNPGPGRRGPGPMLGHPAAQISQSNAQAHYTQAQLERDAARRRSSRPTDLSLPEGLEEIVGDEYIKLYNASRERGKKKDLLMMRKRLELTDRSNSLSKRYKKLRIYISNTAENQPWHLEELPENSFDFSNLPVAKFALKIEGRLQNEDTYESLQAEMKDDDDSEDEDDGPEIKSEDKPKLPHKFLSDFFSEITISFDQSGSRRIPPTTWKKNGKNKVEGPQHVDFDVLRTVKNADENVNCTVSFTRLETPETFKVSPELRRILDEPESNRMDAVKGIWTYIKFMKLLDEEDKRTIHCDDWLRDLFKSDTVFFPSIPELIAPHLTALDPIVLNYTVRLDREFQANPVPSVWEFRVPVENSLRQMMINTLAGPESTANMLKIKEIEERQAQMIQAISRSKARWEFFNGFSKDPANFMRRWLDSQKRDLETVLGETGRGVQEPGVGDEWRLGGQESVWSSQESKETAAYWLSRMERQPAQAQGQGFASSNAAKP